MIFTEQGYRLSRWPKAIVHEKSDIVKRIKFLSETHIPAIWNMHLEEAEKGFPTTSTSPFFGSFLPEKATERQPPIEKELPGFLQFILVLFLLFFRNPKGLHGFFCIPASVFHKILNIF